jgi:hypothetical protein
MLAALHVQHPASFGWTERGVNSARAPSLEAGTRWQLAVDAGDRGVIPKPSAA